MRHPMLDDMEYTFDDEVDPFDDIARVVDECDMNEEYERVMYDGPRLLVAEVYEDDIS